MKNLAAFLVCSVGLAICTLASAEHHGHEHADEQHEHGDHHSHEHEAGWFDSANCDICLPMAERMDLMMAIKWETHKSENGMVMVALIPEEIRGTFDTLCTQMHNKADEIVDSGEHAHLCGFCESMGKLNQAGAKEELIKAGFGNITLVTSDDPATVKLIHQHAERTQEEAKKFEEMMSKMQAN